MCLVRWDQVEGGVVWLKFPEDLEISENAIQQIQISHNFTESYITIKETGWNSISYCNEKKEVIIVLILSEFDDSSDYMICVEEFNKYLENDLKERELLEKLEETLNMEVFRTTEEVIAKLSNEWSATKMKLYEIEGRIEGLLERDILSVKDRIIFSLMMSDLPLKELIKKAKASKKWTESVIQTLIKNNIVKYNNNNDTYFLCL